MRGSRCCASRPPSRPAGPTAAWPTTSPRPATTSAGSRSPSTAPSALAATFEADNDDYRAIMVKALADRLAEAFAEYIHLQARRDWFEPDADPAIEDLHAERFRGIRPGARLPGQPGPQPEAGSCSTCSTPSSSAWA